MTDPVFEALSNVPNHLSSFSASLKDGSVIQSTMASRLDTDKATKSAYHLVNNGIMLAKTTPTMQQDKLKRITVTFPSKYHTFTISNDTIYGIERTHTPASQ